RRASGERRIGQLAIGVLEPADLVDEWPEPLDRALVGTPEDPGEEVRHGSGLLFPRAPRGSSAAGDPHSARAWSGARGSSRWRVARARWRRPRRTPTVGSIRSMNGRG